MKSIIIVVILFALQQNLWAQSAGIDTFIRSYIKQHDFGGTILIHKDSKITYEKSFGLANRSFNVPNKVETKYKIASVTKLFTAVLIMQLYEQGKIDLNKTIKNYLPNYKGEGADKVRIHQLLNHTSGMVNMDTVTSFESALRNGIPASRYLSSDEVLIKYCSDTLINEPGKVYNYNNAEYIILGKILEKIYAKSFDVILKEKILDPLLMKNSGILYQSKITEGLADTYFFRADLNRLVNDCPYFIDGFYSAGAMYSTANDILKFANGLYNYKLLKKESVDIMMKPGLGASGYGVWIYDSEINNRKYKTIKRSGSIGGAQTRLVYFPTENLTLIILSNSCTTSLDDFVFQISKRVLK